MKKIFFSLLFLGSAATISAFMDDGLSGLDRRGKTSIVVAPYANYTGNQDGGINIVSVGDTGTKGGNTVYAPSE